MFQEVRVPVGAVVSTEQSWTSFTLEGTSGTPLGGTPRLPLTRVLWGSWRGTVREGGGTSVPECQSESGRIYQVYDGVRVPSRISLVTVVESTRLTVRTVLRSPCRLEGLRRSVNRDPLCISKSLLGSQIVSNP